MIDINKAINTFELYVDKFDGNEKNIILKKNHSYAVMQYSIDIAKNQNLSKEEIELVALIGLLHDIARFEQWKKYKTFQDLKSVDHGDLGIEILFKDGLIRSFIDTDEYDDIIKCAIKNHNKFSIDAYGEKEQLFCNIIRDADKLDIFNIITKRSETLGLDYDTISDNVYNAFVMHRTINFQEIKTEIDRRLLGIAMIFDLNFDYSLIEIYNKGYVDSLFNVLYDKSKNSDTKNKLLLLKEICKSYIKGEVYAR